METGFIFDREFGLILLSLLIGLLLMLTTLGTAVLSLVLRSCQRTRGLARFLAETSMISGALLLFDALLILSNPKVEAWILLPLALLPLAVSFIAFRNRPRQSSVQCEEDGKDRSQPVTVVYQGPRCVSCDEPLALGNVLCPKCGWTQPI